jgi:hypothetical protein
MKVRIPGTPGRCKIEPELQWHFRILQAALQALQVLDSESDEFVRPWLDCHVPVLIPPPTPQDDSIKERRVHDCQEKAL